MQFNDFIFTPGIWLGEGKITLSASPEFMKFYTKWDISQEDSGQIIAVQIVEIQGVEDKMLNRFTFVDQKDKTFQVVLENEIVGKVYGTGLIDERIIGWEFPGDDTFGGFETYEKLENGDYFLHAEYGYPDHFRTIIEGLIWKSS